MTLSGKIAVPPSTSPDSESPARLKSGRRASGVVGRSEAARPRSFHGARAAGSKLSTETGQVRSAAGVDFLDNAMSMLYPSTQRASQARSKPSHLHRDCSPGSPKRTLSRPLRMVVVLSPHDEVNAAWRFRLFPTRRPRLAPSRKADSIAEAEWRGADRSDRVPVA